MKKVKPMTGEETKRIKEKFESKFVNMNSYDFRGHHLLNTFVSADIWQFIESEIITPYELQLKQLEKQMEQVERETQLSLVEKLHNFGYMGKENEIYDPRRVVELTRAIFGMLACKIPDDVCSMHKTHNPNEFMELLKSQNTQTK